MNFWRPLRPQAWEKTKKGGIQKSSGYIQKRAENYTNTLENFILHKKYQPRPTDCKKIYKKDYANFFGIYREEFVNFLGVSFSFFA